MTIKQVVRWGIIGVGDVCEVKSGPAFYKAPYSQLLAVMRRDGEKAQAFASRHGIPAWYESSEALLANPDIDAVYIATPPAFHREYAIKALEAGKNVYIEKPVTLNASECEDIIAVRDKTGNKVCVAHYRRSLPCFKQFIDLIRAGAIGEPLLVSIDMLQPAASAIISHSKDNWRINPALSGGGLFHDLAPHQLDLVLQWFGAPLEAGGMANNQRQLNQADDCVMGFARLASGVMFQGRWHFAVGKQKTRDLCEVIGSAGKISINFFGQQLICLDNTHGEQKFELPNPPHIQQPFIEQVNDYFRSEGDNPCSIEEAKIVMELMDTFSQHKN